MSSPVRRVLIVLPAYNEEDSIAAVLSEIRSHHPDVSCLVVDDGSADATAEVARRVGVPVARLPFNLGVGGAMRLGFRYALEEGFDAVVQVDADGQHDPAAVPALLRELADADIVVGARFAGVGSYQATGLRRIAMRVIASVLSRTAKTTLTDATSGFKACGPRAIALFADHMPAEYLGDTVEALVIAARAGMRIVQVPVAMRARAGGRPSHDPIKSAIYLVRAFVALGFAFLRPAPHVRDVERTVHQ
jgi:glycosyltransferase involved in cell wall biosynthesis